jgi:hypothetical protein
MCLLFNRTTKMFRLTGSCTCKKKNLSAGVTLLKRASGVRLIITNCLLTYKYLYVLAQSVLNLVEYIDATICFCFYYKDTWSLSLSGN